MEVTPKSPTANAVREFLQALLTALASFFLPLLALTFAIGLHGIGSSRQTGLTAVAGGMVESFLSPWFWLAFLITFTCFHTAARLDTRWLRLILFWIPTVAITTVSVALWISLVLLLSRLNAQ